MLAFRDRFARTLAAYIGLGVVAATLIHFLAASSPKYRAFFESSPAGRSTPSEGRGLR